MYISANNCRIYCRHEWNKSTSSNYDNVVVNGSWNGWNGWGVILYDEDGGIGSLEIDRTNFEYVVL